LIYTEQGFVIVLGEPYRPFVASRMNATRLKISGPTRRKFEAYMIGQADLGHSRISLGRSTAFSPPEL
jgi:hypothetical protein